MDAALMSVAREIVRENLDYPALLDQITDEEDLVNAGVNSGEIIRVALGCENRLDRPLTDVELSRITSVRSVAELLGRDAEGDVDANAEVSADTEATADGGTSASGDEASAYVGAGAGAGADTETGADPSATADTDAEADTRVLAGSHPRAESEA